MEMERRKEEEGRTSFPPSVWLPMVENDGKKVIYCPN